MLADYTYRVALFGHRDFGEHKMLDKYLLELLKDLIRSQDFLEVYIGRNGEFDVYAATVMKRAQKELGKSNNDFICVLPYPNKDAEYYEKYYDSVIIPDCLHAVHPKGAIIKRNRWMVEQADLVVCYVERKSGGAYRALRYAEMLGKQVVNLATAELRE